MTPNWLGREWPQLYPIMPNSSRFQLKSWGDVIDRSAAGVYVVVALDPEAKENTPRILPRLFEKDPSGTLYIGASGNLASRLGELCGSTRPDMNGNGHGLKKLRESPWCERFPASSLAICWWRTPDRESAHKLEADYAITKYAKLFGERPPFDGFK
ncbi:hypothetical protein [Acidiphilium sp.]|uniref:hypothetical protein n=1 Tax=Acidiphilium sp. TaxID=527 RepID=UPI003CFC9385